MHKCLDHATITIPRGTLWPDHPRNNPNYIHWSITDFMNNHKIQCCFYSPTTQSK